MKKKKIKDVSIKYFAKKNNKYKSNFNFIFDELENSKTNLNIQKIKYGRSFCIKLKNLHNFSLKLLKKNKYSFVMKNL